MTKAIIGFGSLGRQIREFVTGEDREDVVVFDDFAISEVGLRVHPFADFMAHEWHGLEFYIGLGYNHLKLREQVLYGLKPSSFPVVIHPKGSIARSASIGNGSVIYPGVVIDNFVRVGNAVLLNNGVLVSHDCVIEDACFVAPGVVICGNVQIGKRCFVGAGAVLCNGITIGDDVIIGAGTLVATNLPSGVKVVGNPMRLAPNLVLR
jgi:sugar O-acyltransferase (sialic acid O-acetyltransferase NeuD family)